MHSLSNFNFACLHVVGYEKNILTFFSYEDSGWLENRSGLHIEKTANNWKSMIKLAQK